MYYPDLTPYAYGGAGALPTVVNVGWLSGSHPYTRGATPGNLLAVLQTLAESPLNLYRGSHQCEFCRPPPVTVRNGLEWMEPAVGTFGNGEVRVVGENGTTFVAPVLVVHYIKAHGYLPPQEFIAAVLKHVEGA